MESEHQVPIWFFVGALLLVYGVIIFGAGIWALVSPPEHRVALYEYHADIWWGALMTVVGVIYCVRFNPFRAQEE